MTCNIVKTCHFSLLTLRCNMTTLLSNYSEVLNLSERNPVTT